MSAAPAAAALTSQPDPHQDRAAAASDTPTRSGRLLSLVRKLIVYGKELVSTLQQRSSATQSDDITRNFGTLEISLILARIMRGLRLAAALEGRIAGSAARLDRPPSPTATLTGASASASAAAPPRKPRAASPVAQPRARYPSEIDPRLADLPTPEEIAADVRRRPIGAVIADICSDLGIVPSHPLWREVTDAVTHHGGSFIRHMRDMFKRLSILNFFPPDTPLIPPMPPGWRAPSPRSATAFGTGPP